MQESTKMVSVILALAATGSISAQTVAPAYATDYMAFSLGSVAGVPSQYGGLTFLNRDTLLLGGAANTSSAAIYSIPVIRDMNGFVSGFGTASVYASAGFPSGGIDGGLVIAPNGSLLFTSYPNNLFGIIKPGNTSPDKSIDLSALGVASSVGSVQIVPDGQPGQGRLKFASYNSSIWYDGALVPDGQGTYDVVLSGTSVQLSGGLEGVAYVPTGSPLFTSPTVLVSEYNNGAVSVYDADSNGDPILGTRQLFLSGLSGAEGATIDPFTGDFFFSTFGGGSQIVRVTGFAVVPEPAALGLALPAMAMLARRRR